MHLPEGHLLQRGKYRLVCVVGQGGFGITYKGVWHTEVKAALGSARTELPVAVKEYFFKDYCFREEGSAAVKVHSETGKALFGKFREKLIEEARILSAVQHKFIVNVLEVFEENNTAYIVMEYIPGLSLKEKVEKEGRLPEAKVLKYARQLGEALSFVHRQNIIHMDIKPSNVLIDGQDNARLIDFGVSKRFDDAVQDTSTTMLALSKGFAAIEQYDSEGTMNFSPAPDIYSLGATMYYLLTGCVPTESILRVTHTLTDPLELNPAISLRTREAVLRAMEVSPADRFATIEGMLSALDTPSEACVQNPEGTSLGPAASPSLSADHTELHRPLPVRGDLLTRLWKPKESSPADEKKKVYLAAIFAIVTVALIFVLAATDGNNGVDDASTDADVTSVVQEGDAPAIRQEEPQEPPLPTAASAAPAEIEPAAEPVAEVSANAAIARRIRDLEEKAAMDRVSGMYEVKNITFGKLRIVKKNETGLYGAIDAAGNEQIPCKYLYNDKAAGGRAFARPDNLFDIYDDEGLLLDEGVKRY
ncbi:MAG: serine/threonine protein kinase [Tannerellaceae bacterium]|jgi:serine/threonine-protein kinase|nr:serine/threonine protein kinase [Tannerellaceae bacterium]